MGSYRIYLNVTLTPAICKKHSSLRYSVEKSIFKTRDLSGSCTEILPRFLLCDYNVCFKKMYLYKTNKKAF